MAWQIQQGSRSMAQLPPPLALTWESFCFGDALALNLSMHLFLTRHPLYIKKPIKIKKKLISLKSCFLGFLSHLIEPSN